MKLKHLLSIRPPPDPRRPIVTRCQVFHGADHLTQKRQGFRRRLGSIRSGRQKTNDRIALAIQRRERTWEA